MQMRQHANTNAKYNGEHANANAKCNGNMQMQMHNAKRNANGRGQMPIGSPSSQKVPKPPSRE